MAQIYRATAEQRERFSIIKHARLVKTDIALFAFCLVYDIPYRPEIMVDDWGKYLDELTDEENHAGFAQGETDINAALENGMNDQERWERQWGLGDENNPYTAQDYRQLDDIFHRYTARLSSSGGYDVQQEDTLRHCSRMALLRDKCIANGSKEAIDKAKNLDKMIQDNLAAENLRKKDAKPVETARVDGIIDALRKKYGVGMELTKDQAFQMYYEWCRQHHYPVTQDAVEHAILSIINTMRANADQEPLDVLPKKMRLTEYATEFEAAPSITEQETYKYLGIDRGWPPETPKES